MDSATLSYRAILPGPVYFTSGSADKEMTIAERMQRFDLAAMLPPKLNEINLAAVVLLNLPSPTCTLPQGPDGVGSRHN